MDILDQEDQTIIERCIHAEDKRSTTLHVVTFTLTVVLMALVIITLAISIINNNKFSVLKRICLHLYTLDLCEKPKWNPDHSL